MIGEWENAWRLQTPSGNLFFNQQVGTEDFRFQLVPARCFARLPVRVTDDDISQGDGKIPHRRWRSGYGIHLALALLNVDADDCISGTDLVRMLDLLGLHVNETIRTGLVPGAPNARLIFTPTGHAERMFDRIQLSGEPTVSVAEADALGGTMVELDFDTSFPYYIEAAETQTDIAETGTGGAGVIVNNPGNTDYFATLRAFGPYTWFTVINLDTIDFQTGAPLELVYDSTLPGAAAVADGDYIEIDLFRATAYLNGNQANRKAGIDPRFTDFFPFVPGDNELQVVFEGDGANTLLRILSNGSWA